MTRVELSARLNIPVEADPYDIGYWSRIAGLPRPRRTAPTRAGWDQADGELKAEQEEAPND